MARFKSRQLTAVAGIVLVMRDPAELVKVVTAPPAAPDPEASVPVAVAVELPLAALDPEAAVEAVELPLPEPPVALAPAETEVVYVVRDPEIVAVTVTGPLGMTPTPPRVEVTGFPEASVPVLTTTVVDPSLAVAVTVATPDDAKA
jgi:hypothetical protein